MKKKLLLLICVIALQNISFADTSSNPHDAIRKLGTGMYNVVTSPLEVSNNIAETIHEEGLFQSLTYGVVKGAVDGVKKIGVGLYEIITFPIKDTETDGQDILVDPDFFGAQKIQKK
jgi:putative exosortase-associated protein (TIGR04073 family)